MMFRVTGRRVRVQNLWRHEVNSEPAQGHTLERFAVRMVLCKKCSNYNEAFEACNISKQCCRRLCREAEHCPEDVW